MRKLRNTNLNSSEEYEKIFKERKPDELDIARWQQLFKFYKGGTLIDLGCLWSLIPLWAKRKFPKSEIWGLDQAEEAIKFLSEAHPEINYTTGDVYNTTFPDNYFDYMVAGELIEHLEKPTEFFKEAFRILKSGGKLVVSTPKEETEAGEVDQYRHLWSYSVADIRHMIKPYIKGAKIYEFPGWLKRRFKYHHPYLIALITKR